MVCSLVPGYTVFYRELRYLLDTLKLKESPGSKGTKNPQKSFIKRARAPKSVSGFRLLIKKISRVFKAFKKGNG